jgi:Putative beta-barrel porin-2, OmpL-like. bbp2
MRRNRKTAVRLAFACLMAAAWQLGNHSAAWAQQAPPPSPAPPTPAPPPGAPPPPAAPAAPAANAMTTPSMTGPLVANPNPLSFSGGPLGAIYFNGAISGLGLFQNDPVPGDHSADFDVSSGLLSLQNTTGMFQFFVQAGLYSFPAVGTPYLQSWRTTGNFFGPVPVVYGKLVPNDAFSVQVGKLPTLIGAEYGFTFQNMNIERGLLWGQEPIVSRGIQGNYTYGPVAFSLSLNDGFYSGNYDWLSGSATWTVDKINTLALVAGGNFGRARLSTATDSPPFVAIVPSAQNNSTIVNLIYTYSNAPWTVTPYFQLTHVPADPVLGFFEDAWSYGGALLASYAINDNFSLAGRAEIIGTSGSLAGGAPNLLFGPGSAAVSFTLTPTWQRGIFFARAEGSVVSAWSTTPTFVFGSTGNTKTQGRLVLEGGIVF